MLGRLLVNVVLLACAVALGLWIYQHNRDGDDGRLTRLDGEAVQRIVIEGGQQRMVFARAGTGWRMLVPRELPASRHHVDMLLRFLQAPVHGRYDTSEVDLAAAGLTPPKVTLRYDERAFAFGALDPLGQRRYLVDGDRVLLVSEGISAILLSPWWNFIDRRLLPAGEPKRLVFADGRELALDRDPSLQARWQHAAASIVRPLRPGVAGEEVVLELDSGERIVWQWVAGEQPKLLRPDLGLAYQISSDQRAALFPDETLKP
jgi:hypothetical protein